MGDAFTTRSSFDVLDQYAVEDGKLHIRRVQPDLDGFLAENRELAADAPKSVGPAGFRLVGRIPLVVYEQWARECGAQLGSPELAAYVKTKLQNGEFAKLAVKGY